MKIYKKNRKYLFVDGYNILNHIQKLKEISVQDLELARELLMDMLAEHSTITGEYIILVFDGYKVKKSPGSTFHRKGIDVVFTKEFETADAYIEHELDKIGRLHTVRVATSDNMEQQLILSRGGTRLSARELENEILEGKKKIKRKTKELKKDKINTMTRHMELLEKLKDEYQ